MVSFLEGKNLNEESKTGQYGNESNRGQGGKSRTRANQESDYRSSHQQCSIKKEMKILQNSQENNCASLFFNKIAGLNLQLY